MRSLTAGYRQLPDGARRIVGITVVVAATLAGAAFVLPGGGMSPTNIVLISISMVGGELFRVVLPYRHDSSISFSLSDAALMGALLLTPPQDVVAGVIVGVTAWQIIDRAEAIKAVFNCCQYLAGAAAAALLVHALAPRPAPLNLPVLAALSVGLAAFLAINTLTVASIVATMSGQPIRHSMTRMLPTNALVTACNGALALLAVALWDEYPWTLPALAAPLALLYLSSRQRVRAQVDQERSSAFVAVEHRLGDARDHQEVCRIISEGVASVLALAGGVWRDGRWATDVPADSRPCPLDPHLPEVIRARGAVLGPNVPGECAGIGLGGGVLVVWPGDLDITQDTFEWLERLARSARVHFERVTALVALEQERATLRAVVDGTADGILVLDGSGVIRVWNPAMEMLGGTAADDVLGRHARDVLGLGPWDVEGIHDVARRGDGTEDGERVWRVAVASVRDERFGDLRVAVVHDVTTERRVARMKDDMLAIVSHELRTPLTPIKASAQLLYRRWDRLGESQRSELLAQIEHRADHLARLVEDLLLVAQLSSATGARPRVVPMPTDLAAAVRRDVEQLAEAYPSHDIRFQGPEGLNGVTDTMRLRQVLGNLIDNACKFSPPGSPVVIRLRPDGRDVLLQVEDEGRGIPREDRERVFERFERLEDPLHMTTSGAGLGLFIVRALATALGGGVWIDAGGPTGGTVVCVRLPLTGLSPRPVWDESPALGA